jgi:hypothetical protein
LNEGLWSTALGWGAILIGVRSTLLYPTPIGLRFDIDPQKFGKTNSVTPWQKPSQFAYAYVLI